MKNVFRGRRFEGDTRIETRPSTSAQQTNTLPPPGARGLERSLGMLQITASGVGIIIGAGIYVLLGAATAQAGAAVWLAFLVAGLLSALTALSYAELAAMYPKAGAEYDYTRRVAPDWLAFVIGWVMILALVIAAAAVSLGFANYVNYFVDVEPRLAALGLIVFVAGIALAGIEHSARLTVALSTVQVGGLCSIIAIGIPHVGDHDLLAGASSAGVVTAAALVFFAFVGFDEVITLAEETTNPARTVPRALLLALAVSTVLFVAVAIAAVSVLGPVALGASDQPLSDVMAEAIGGRAAGVVAVIAMVATTNTTLLALTAASRLVYGMADSGALPPAFAQVSRQKAPWRAILAAGLVAASFVAIGDLKLVAGVTDFSVYVVFIAVNVTVIVLRFWQPKRWRPFAIRGTIARVPIPPVLALGTIALLMPSLEPSALAIGVVVMAVGLGVHLILPKAQAVDIDLAEEGNNHVVPKLSVTIEEALRVAEALRVDQAAVPFDIEQFRTGMQVELEHGTGDPDTNITNDDLLTTGKIALAHLNEIPDYYSRLAVMEAEAREQLRG